MLHLHDHRRATGDKRAARLGPQPRVRQAETLEACLDFREVCTERRRLHIRITHRETTADIDHLDCHAGIADHLADQGQRISPGKWLEALRTDMEAQPEARSHEGVPRTATPPPAPAPRRTCPTDPAPPAPLAWQGGRSVQARRQHRSQPFHAGSSHSSSALSSTKSRTPWRCHASRMAPRDLTGCMKWIEASENI